MDISHTLKANSDQLDAIELLGGAQDFTIEAVTENNSEQPINVRLAEFERPWRPGVTMRRLLSSLWGPETDEWIGHKVRLYRDDAVTFGKTKPGGTRVSHASHIEKKVTLTLPTSKGKFGEFTVEPLIESAPESEPTAKAVAACDDPDELRSMWQASGPERRAQIEARVAELAKTEPEPTNDQWNDVPA